MAASVSGPASVSASTALHPASKMLKQVVSLVAFVALVMAEEVVERKVPPGAFIARTATNLGDPILWKEDFKYSALDGTEREESLSFKEVDEKLVPEIRGSYSYEDADGRVIILKYKADENGFQPEGDHIPRPVEQIPLVKKVEEKLPFGERQLVVEPKTTTTTTTTFRPFLSTRKPFPRRTIFV